MPLRIELEADQVAVRNARLVQDGRLVGVDAGLDFESLVRHGSALTGAVASDGASDDHANGAEPLAHFLELIAPFSRVWYCCLVIDRHVRVGA